MLICAISLIRAALIGRAAPLALLVCFAATFAVLAPVHAEDGRPHCVPSETPEGSPSPAWSEPSGTLRLGEALALALECNPELAAFSWRVRATEARRLQAGLRPNPEAALTLEDVAGSGAFSGVGEAQTTLQLSQLVEIGGKRARRMREAELSRDVAGWDYEAKRLDVFVDTARAFVDVLGSQTQLALAGDAVQLARHVVKTAATRVEAGSASLVEMTKAKVAFASAEIEQAQLRRALEVARKRLAAMWGSTVPSFTEARGDIDAIKPVPSIEVLRERLARNPDLVRWTSEIKQRQAVVELEQSQAIPNVTASAGYRRLSGPEDNALVFGFSVPLPLLNRNQGAILEAQRLVAEGREAQRAAHVRVAMTLAESHEALATAYEQINAFRNNVLPGAEGAFEILNQGYREGRFTYLDVLDAQRTLIAARAQHVRALMDYHKSVAALERVIGEPVHIKDAQHERD
jgi:cobalt-zinc-cadmium efflux system outer membrane protein